MILVNSLKCDGVREKTKNRIASTEGRKQNKLGVIGKATAGPGAEHRRLLWRCHHTGELDWVNPRRASEQRRDPKTASTAVAIQVKEARAKEIEGIPHMQQVNKTNTVAILMMKPAENDDGDPVYPRNAFFQ